MKPTNDFTNIENQLKIIFTTQNASDLFVDRLEKKLSAQWQVNTKLEPKKLKNHSNHIFFHPVYWIGFCSLVIVLGIMVTPIGKVWAQEIIKFFTLASSDVIPAPTAQVPELVDAEIAAKVTSAGLWQPEFFSKCGSFAAPYCTIDQIRSMVDFKVKSLAPLPEGLTFIGASGGPDWIFITYKMNASGGTIILDEIPEEKSLPPFEAGKSAQIETVTVGKDEAQYVKGFWIAEEGSSQWKSDAGAQTLRWITDGIYYQLSSLEPENVHPDKEFLVSLANGLTFNKVVDQVDLSHINSIEQLRKVVDFDLSVPSELPETYQFGYAISTQGGACLVYNNLKYPGTFQIYISADPVNSPEIRSSLSLPLEQMMLAIDGAENNQGIYIDAGGPALSTLCQSATGEGMPSKALFFTAKGIYYGIYGPENQILTKDMIQALALSITRGENSQNLPDVDHITSLTEVQQYIKFKLKLPTLLPAGAAFEFASIDGPAVTLHYSNGYRLIESTEKTSTDLFLSHIPANEIQKVKIASLDGNYVQGCMMNDQWNSDCTQNTLMWYGHDIQFQITAGLPKETGLNTLVGIAESIK